MSSKLPDGCTFNEQGLVVTSIENLDQLIAKQTALIESDLAWCLGKLQGLGHGNKQMEDRQDKRLDTIEQELPDAK